MILFNLGKYVSVPIISEWLILEDYLHLDSALGKVDRQRFIELIKEYAHLFSSILFPVKGDVFYPGNGVSWAGRRQLEFPVEVTNEFLEVFDVDNVSLWNRVQKMKCININACYVDKLMSIFAFCDALEVIVIRETPSADYYVFQLSVSCPRLKITDFSYCWDLSSDSIVALCRGCPKLEFLELWKCTCLTSDVIRAVIVHSRNITYFRFDIAGQQREYDMLRLHMRASHKEPLNTVFDFLLGESYIQYGAKPEPGEEASEQCDDDSEPEVEEYDEQPDHGEDDGYVSFGSNEEEDDDEGQDAEEGETEVFDNNDD